MLATFVPGKYKHSSDFAIEVEVKQATHCNASYTVKRVLQCKHVYGELRVEAELSSLKATFCGIVGRWQAGVWDWSDGVKWEHTGHGEPHMSGARWSSNQLQAWMMQLPQHTNDMCSKTGRLYVCQTCGRMEKTLTLMEERVCPGFIPDTSIKTKLRKCITWCRKNGSMEEGSMEVRKPPGNSSMLWLVQHQMDVIPMEARLPPQVPPSVATAESGAEVSPGMVATSALSDRTGEAATPVIPPPGAAPVEYPANPASPASVHSSQSGP